MGQVTVITGPPCAGKTTYAAGHRKPGDLIIDFDALATALGCESRHGYSERDHIWWVTLAARTAAITAALEQARRGAVVWIIDAKPGRRMPAYQRAGAVLVPLTASREELHARASKDGRPQAWHARIDAWMDNRWPDDPEPRRVTAW